MVNEQEDADDADDLRHSLSGSLLTQGIPALTLELGGSYVVNEKDVMRGVDALWNILVSLDMCDPIEVEAPYTVPEEAKGVLLSYSHEPTAQMGGILRALSRPGHSAKKGEPLARVYNVFGKLEETLHAEEDCIILGYSDSSAVKPGEPIMAFGVLPKKR
jgi:predicted deacylase